MDRDYNLGKKPFAIRLSQSVDSYQPMGQTSQDQQQFAPCRRGMAQSSWDAKEIGASHTNVTVDGWHKPSKYGWVIIVLLTLD